MIDQSDAARRLAIFRRNNLWRHLSSTLSQIGAYALVAAIVLPAYGLHLPWSVIAVLLGVSGGAIYLSFFCLRFIDYSV